MKKTILFWSALFICTVNSGLLFANNTTERAEDKSIELLGSLNNSGTRSLFSPISAFKHSDCLEVSLSRSLGEISIGIYDEANNIVYNETIDASIQSGLYIDIAFLEIGEYTIEFTNSQGKYLSGNFEIE